MKRLLLSLEVKRRVDLPPLSRYVAWLIVEIRHWLKTDAAWGIWLRRPAQLPSWMEDVDVSSSASFLALVTGAAGGLGVAITEKLLQNGYRVIALDQSDDSLAALRETVGDGCRLIPATFDLTNASELPGFVGGLVEEHGPITRLVNNAGTWARAPIETYPEEVWDKTFAVNVKAPFLLIKTLIPVMKAAGGGRIVNMSSRNAFTSTVNNSAYDATKAALLGLTRTAAGELAGHNIRVNAVCPGPIRTLSNKAIYQDKSFAEAYTKLIPMARYGEPKEVAEVVFFLLSDASGFVTGQTIVADGGQIACQDIARFKEIPRLGSK